jgi:hypothetical protein
MPANKIKCRSLRYLFHEKEDIAPTIDPPAPCQCGLHGLQQRRQYAQTQPQRLQLPHLLTVLPSADYADSKEFLLNDCGGKV